MIHPIGVMPKGVGDGIVVRYGWPARSAAGTGGPVDQSPDRPTPTRGGNELSAALGWRFFAGLVANLHLLVFQQADQAGQLPPVGSDGTVAELATVIDRAMRVELFCPPRIVARLFDRVAELARDHGPIDAAVCSRNTR